jgi:hypothetical protein
MDNSISKIKQHFDINLAECMEELNHMKNIIQNKIEKEKEYISDQIIQMEIKQIAESITRVTNA